VAIQTLPVRAWLEPIVRADEANLAFFAQRTGLPGISLFTAERADAPAFDLALIYHIPAPVAGETLAAIVDHFRSHGRLPRVRLTPLSAPLDWPDRLRRAGFVEIDESHDYIVLPETVSPRANPTVVVERAVSPADANRFSAIQVAAYGIPPAHRAWDRELARRHLTTGRHVFYLASLDGRTVGAARSTYLPGDVAAWAALATLPSARGRGVATSLLRRMADDARAAGRSTIVATVEADGYAAGLYARMGWLTVCSARTFVARS
jgi:GNAT superfamily N-acetyltransferase